MTTVGFKRKLTAILSAGEEGYSHLVREDEVARVETLKMSGRRKLYIWTLSLLAFVVFTSGFGGAATAKSQRKGQQNTEHNVAFRWAFGALVRSEKDWKLVAITPGSKLKTGNRLKMLIELLEDCFVYVIYHSSQGEIRLLFPYDFKQLSRDYETQKQYLIPPGDRWFELDEHLGIETFYLLASVERLFELEALVKKYALLSLAEKGDCKDQILAEIRSLIRRHRRFKTAAERPVQMVGAIRGGHETSKVVRFDLLSIAVEIAADRFYGKSFTIEHQ